MGQWTCEEEGCESGPGTDGRSLYRTSPKGTEFRGRCHRHMRSGIDEADQTTVDVVEFLEHTPAPPDATKEKHDAV